MRSLEVRYLPLSGEGEENFTEKVHLSRLSCRKQNKTKQESIKQREMVTQCKEVPRAKYFWERGREKFSMAEGCLWSCVKLRLWGKLEPFWEGYYIFLKIYVLGNHLSSSSQKLRTTLVNLKAFSVVETPSETVTTNNS